MGAKKVFSTIRSYLLIAIGLLLYTTAWTIFIIPNGMVGGGVTGMSAIIQYCTGIKVAYSYFVINIVLLLIAMKILGRGFGIKTIYAMVLTTIFLRVLPDIISPDFINEIAIQNGKLLSAIMGGLISGFGVAITFNEGGSSGGTDIIALMINKYRAISPGKIIMSLDLVIIASSLIVPSADSWASRIVTVLYGYVITGLFSATVDYVVSGTKQSVQIFVFSKNYEKIAERIATDGHRGVTLLNGRGWYTKEEMQVLVIIARKHDANFLLNMVKEEDANAFISVGTVMGVYGRGFEKIKKK